MGKTFFIAIVLVAVIAAIAAGVFLFGCQDNWCYVFTWQKVRAANSFESCAQLGFPVTESYPRQCRAGDKSFTENAPAPVVPPPAATPATYKDLIHVTSPLQNTVVASPLMVTGEARGSWYFEASFPVRLYDANGKQLATAAAKANGDWMTTNYVPFEVTLTFVAPATQTGTLVLEKDNPSGLASKADSFSVPVRFSNSAAAASRGTLQGTMTIGPICPVERPGDPSCKPTPEIFAARKVLVYSSDHSQLVTTITPDANGKFSASLPVGQYWVNVENQNQRVGNVSGVPQTINIKAGETVTLNIDVDTGIR